MAGRTKTRAVLERLTARAAQEEQTALEYVVSWVADGRTLIELGEQLAKELKYPRGETVGHGMLMRALEYDSTPNEINTAIAKAREEGAHAKVELAERIADTVSADKDQIARAKLRAEVRQWAAVRSNRGSYGDTKATPININIGSLHLDAMRRLQRPPAVLTAPNERASIEDAIVVPNEPAESIDALL